MCVHASVVSMSEKEISFHSEVFMMNMAIAILSFAKGIYCAKVFLSWDIVSAWCLVLEIKVAHPYENLEEQVSAEERNQFSSKFCFIYYYTI